MLIRKGLHTCTCYHSTFNVSFIFAHNGSHICCAIYNRRTIGSKWYFRLSKVMCKLVCYKRLPMKKNKIKGVTLATKPELRKQELAFRHWCLHLCRTYLRNCIWKDWVWCVLAWGDDSKRNKGNSWQTCAELGVHWSAAYSWICPLCGFFNLSCPLGDEEFTKEVTELFSKLHISSKPEKVITVSYFPYSKSWRVSSLERLLFTCFTCENTKCMKTSYILDLLAMVGKGDGPLTLWGRIMWTFSHHSEKTYSHELKASSWYKAPDFTVFRSWYEEESPFLPSFHYRSDPPSGSSILQTCF